MHPPANLLRRMTLNTVQRTLEGARAGRIEPSWVHANFLIFNYYNCTYATLYAIVVVLNCAKHNNFFREMFKNFTQ